MHSDLAPVSGPYTWQDEDVTAYVAMLGRLGLTAHPEPLLQVWSSESGLSPCPPRNGPAVGICQFEPGTLQGLGYDLAADPRLEAFVALPVAAQLVYAERYYHTGARYCDTLAGAYAWTFLPAQAAKAHADSGFVLCGATMPYPGAYAANWRAFDPSHSGLIRGCDLETRALRAWGDRGKAILARVQAALAAP